MDLGLKGRNALVLAAGSGLGAAVALSLAREGASVAVAGRTGTSVHATVDAIADAGGRAHPVIWDLADIDAIDRHVADIENALGPIGILINNSGGPPPTPAAGIPARLWREQFETMVMALIATTDRVLPGMRAEGWGRIITSASSGIIAPIQGLALSNALRSTLAGWSKTLAREVAKQGITVNIVVPGRIETARLNRIDTERAARNGLTLEGTRRMGQTAIPIGRYGTPREYADVVTFLASSRASYLTGATIRVDGGMIASL